MSSDLGTPLANPKIQKYKTKKRSFRIIKEEIPESAIQIEHDVESMDAASRVVDRLVDNVGNLLHL